MITLIVIENIHDKATVKYNVHQIKLQSVNGHPKLGSTEANSHFAKVGQWSWWFNASTHRYVAARNLKYQVQL